MRGRLRFSLGLAAGCAVAASAAGNDGVCEPLTGLAGGCAPSVVVQTSHGPVRGFTRQKDAPYKDDDTAGVEVSTFWGIPFADPPVGENRFRSPQPLSRTWAEPLNATTRSATCLTSGLAEEVRDAPKNLTVSSEDCLYLNVYTPSAAIGKSQLPVMVWLYGGGYVGGNAYQVVLGQAAYDGAVLVGRNDVVVVTMNYRLNGLGFFASEELQAEDSEGSTGNMALRDQRAAMQWVQANIANFGGNPNNVTLFGESAGGFSVMWHLVSEPSWPLFHRAIMESGTSRISWFFQPADGAKEFYAEWSQLLGCPRSGPGMLPCLRKLPGEQFITPPLGINVSSPGYVPSKHAVMLPFGPVVDGTKAGLAGIPLTLVQQGHFNKVPLMLGACKDGGSIFEVQITDLVPGMHPPYARNQADIELALNWAVSPPDVPHIEAAYTKQEFDRFLLGPDWAKMMSRMIRDMTFQCSNRALAQAWASHNVPVWLYTFSFDLGPLDKISGLGDLHASDLLFVWRHFLWVPETLHMFGDAKGMADLVSCKWTTFAHTSDPDGAGPESLPPNCATVQQKNPRWPQYTAESRQYYSLQEPPKVVPLRQANKWPDDEFPSDVRCDAWDSVTYPWHNFTDHPLPPGTSTVVV